MFTTRFCGPHSGGDTLADQRRFQFGHGANDGEHCPAHGAFGVDLILYAYEAHAQMVEFLKRSQQVARAAREAVEFPDQDTIDLMVPSGCHQGIEPRATLPPA